MTQSINSTIVSAVSAKGIDPTEYPYASYVEAVETALEAREYDIVDAIVELAQGYAAAEDVRNILTQAGLSERPAPVVVPEPEVEVEVELEVTEEQVSGTSKGKKSKRLDTMEKKVDDLTASVNQLVQLANRHLGASL